MTAEKTMAILIGIQGSGKSTFYRRYLANDYVHVNLDTLKTRHRERLLVADCIQAGKNIAIDNTNPTRQDREHYITPAQAAGYRIVGYFMESTLHACIARNAQREGSEKIPAKAIAATSNKLELPSYAEGFDRLYYVKNDGTNMSILDWRETDEF